MFSIEKDKDGDDHHHRDAGTHAVITPYLDLVEHPERPLPKRCTNCRVKLTLDTLPRLPLGPERPLEDADCLGRYSSQR